MTANELKSKFPRASRWIIQANATDPDRVASHAEQQQDTQHEPLGKDARKAVDQSRRIVRFTSYRLRLCDERNLHDKAFTDALVESGLLVDDSEAWCKVEVAQRQVMNAEDERTEIEIYAL